MASLLQALPAPVNPTYQAEEEDQASVTQSAQALSLAPPITIPAYGSRRGWKPRLPDHFGDGGAYPECHLAQYPLEMGRKKHASIGNTLSLTVDGDGKIDYTKIAKQGHRDGRHVQAQFKDLVPLAHRADLSAEDRSMHRPSTDEVDATTQRTRAALEKLTNSKIKAAQPKHVPETGGTVSFVRYTPNTMEGATDGPGKQRIIKMVEVVEDPLEPPRFKHKKIPRGPPSPPAPILRSPPRKVTSLEQKEWMIPPCISNWKNNKGYTIPLDKRLAADGRGLQDTHINDRFAQLSESLYIADRHAREEVRQRSLLQQRLAQKEKEQKEENLRLLAQRAREERSGIPRAVTATGGGSMPAAVAGYGSDSGDESEQGSASEDGEDGGADEAAAKARDEIRRENRQDLRRKLQMNNMGTEKRAQHLARTQNRDISEKIALGLAKPTMSKESMIDSRLFNQESYSGTFGDEDSYNLYDKPLFTGSSAAAAIYKRGGAQDGGDDGGEQYGGGTEEGISNAMRNDRFGLGVAGKGFEGADLQDTRDGPVQFERDTTAPADPFAIDAFLDEAKKGVKRGLDQRGTNEESKKRRG